MHTLRFCTTLIGLTLWCFIASSQAMADVTEFKWKFDLHGGSSIGDASTQDTDVINSAVATAVLQASATLTYAAAEPTTGGTSAVLLSNTGTSNHNGAYFQVADSDALTGHANGGSGFTALTIDVWINPAELKQAQIVRKTSGNYNGFDFGLSSSGQIFFGVHGLGDDTSYIYSGATVQTGTWHHVVGSWDGTAGTISVSIDGVTTATESLTTSLRNTSTPLAIGALIREPGSTGQFFNGTIDELKITGTWSTDPIVEPGPAQLTTIGSWEMELPSGAQIGDSIVSIPSSTGYDLPAQGIIQSTSTLTYAAPDTGSASAFFGNTSTSDDDGSYLSVANSQWLTGFVGSQTGYNAVEFSLRFRLDAARQCQLFRLGGTSLLGFQAYTRPDNKILVEFYDAQNRLAQLYSSNTYTVGQWSTLSVRWDQGRRPFEGDLSVTLNGTTTYLISQLDSMPNFNGPLTIGGRLRDNGTTGQFFFGAMDEFQYKVAPLPPSAADVAWVLY